MQTDPGRVIHVTSVHRWNDPRIFEKECKSLAAAGYEVHLVYVAHEDSDPSGNTEGVILHPESWKVGRLKRMLYASARLWETCRDLDGQVYHFHDPELIPLGLRLQKMGKHVIYDAHEDVPVQLLAKPWLPSVLRPWMSRMFRRYEDKACRQFSALITVTDFIGERFSALNAETTLVKNYPKLEDLPEPSGSSDRRKSLFYVGDITVIRGIREMVKSLEWIDADAALNLAGPFATEELEQEIRALPTWDRVQYHGYIDRHTKAQLLAEVSIGLVVLHPTRNYLDALPVKMFEYMGAGLPVISSNIPLWASILEEHNCGLAVDPFDPQAIADAANHILSNPELAAEMGRNGRKAVETEYNWKSQEKQLVSLYSRLISRS